MHFIAPIASFIGYTLLIVLAFIGFVIAVLFIIDTVRFSEFRRRLSFFHSQRHKLRMEMELQSMSIPQLYELLDCFHPSEHHTEGQKIELAKILDVIQAEIGGRLLAIEKQTPSKSLLPFLFIPYVDGLAQFVGYCILIPLFIALIGMVIVYTVARIRNARFRKELNKQNARIIKAHQELDLQKLSSSDLTSNLLMMQDRVKDTPVHDPAYPGFVEIVNSIQNELSKRPWAKR